MDSYTSMKTKLNATGYYFVTEGGLLSFELIAYGAGLELLFSELDEMLGEMFIPTAQSYGIENRESFIGNTREEYSLEKRREMLIIGESAPAAGCTPADFTRVLQGYGLESFEFSENPTAFELTIIINDELTEAQKKLVRERAEKDFPLHLTLNISN